MIDLNNFYKGKRVLVTGATGFVGSYLCKELVKKDCIVTGLVQEQSNLWRLNQVLHKINIESIDLSELNDVKSVFTKNKPDMVFHFAIPPHELLQNETDLEKQITITGIHLKNLFQSINSEMLGKTKFIHACSGAIYKWSSDNYILRESTQIQPTTLRGKLKSEQRETCLRLSHDFGIDVLIARIFRAYGPWEINSKLIVKALECYKKGEPISLGSDRYKRDYIYVGDLVNGILMLGASNQESGTEMNFGSSEQYSSGEIVELLEGELGVKIPKLINAYPKNNYDQGNFIADCKKANDLLGWESKVSIEEGLKETVSWFLGQDK